MLDLSTATIISSLKGEPLTGELTQEHASALYKVDLPKPGRLVVSLTGLTGDADIILRSPDGDIVASGVQDRYVSMNPDQAAEYLDTGDVGFPVKPKTENLHAGTYVIDVALKQGQTGTKFVLTVKDKADSPLVVDAGEVETAAMFRGVIKHKKTPNTYKFSVKESAKYMVFVVANSADPVVFHLKDAGGEELTPPILDNSAPITAYQTTQDLKPGEYSLDMTTEKRGELRYLVAVQKIVEPAAAFDESAVSPEEIPNSVPEKPDASVVDSKS
jgi:hypothetical protein